MPFRKERDKNGTNTIILSNKYCKNNRRSNKAKSTNRDIQKSNRNTNKNTKTNNHKTKRYRYNHQYQVTEKDMQYIIQKICENSIYAYKEQISQGYITIKGGHRIGITGTCVIENQKISNIKYISSLNFRIAREVKGCSQKILKDVIDQEHNTIYNTLIVSPPGKGKTTILRDTIRNISNGIPEMNFRGKICGVVDERGEIAAMYKGIPQNDIGIRTDVIENVSKYNEVLRTLIHGSGLTLAIRN